MLQTDQRRVLIPLEQWTPFPNDVFSCWRDLEQHNAAALHAILYDRAHHKPVPLLKVTSTNLSKWSGLKSSVVDACLDELQAKKLIRLKKDSRCEVPLAGRFDLQRGKWIPIPRFLVRRYIPAYPEAVLLLVLLQHQHFRWQNDCFPNVRTLSDKTGWRETRVDDAIRTMSEGRSWKRVGGGLPRPLTVEFHRFRNTAVRHYHVRAVRYELNTKNIPVVRLAKLFARKFAS